MYGRAQPQGDGGDGRVARDAPGAAPDDRGRGRLQEITAGDFPAVPRSGIGSRGVPVREWRRKKGVRGEVLDCRTYAFAALQALIAMGISLEQKCERIEMMAAKSGERAAPRITYSRCVQG